MGPLHDIRVIDLSRVLAGPYCGQLLADLGAEVIKIESPEGDENRQWGPRAENGVTCNYNSVNRGKLGITLNLRTEGAKRVLRQLIERADVVIHSFLPDSADRLGLSYQQVKAIRPDIVFCSINGYGEKGKLRNRPGYDVMVQAFSGIMSTTGEPDGPPLRVGISAVDMATGLTAFGGIMTALYKRKCGGGGDWVRVSLLETALSLIGYQAVSTLQAGVLPKREDTGLAVMAPYQAFRAKDGWLQAGAPNDAAWRRFATALGRAELADDPRFLRNQDRLDNRPALLALIEPIIASATVEEWIERLDKAGVACAPMHTMDQVVRHPQVLANDMVVEVETMDGGKQKVLGAPFKLNEHSGVAKRAAPLLGADTWSVLRDVLGLSVAEISALRAEGAM
jgi:crotonobetainyl-CoA:carnitine CoA-transferase CaiB-like acyl-CoA transferase